MKIFLVIFVLLLLYFHFVTLRAKEYGIAFLVNISDILLMWIVLSIYTKPPESVDTKIFIITGVLMITLLLVSLKSGNSKIIFSALVFLFISMVFTSISLVNSDFSGNAKNLKPLYPIPLVLPVVGMISTTFFWIYSRRKIKPTLPRGVIDTFG